MILFVTSETNGNGCSCQSSL